MANYVSDRNGTSIDTVLDDADAGNIGKTTLTSFTGDVDTISAIGFTRVGSTATNLPTNVSGTLITSVARTTDMVQQYTSLSNLTFIRAKVNGNWGSWRQLYSNGNGRDGASIDTVLDNADASNIGKGGTISSSDIDGISISKTSYFPSSTAGAPSTAEGCYMSASGGKGFTAYTPQDNKMYFRTTYGALIKPWEELYHTGNTGVTEYSDGAPASGIDVIRFSKSFGVATFSRPGTSNNSTLIFKNDNGTVGEIKTSGTATSYNTSSDPRLKEFGTNPSDAAINEEFNKLFSCFRVFKWKTDLTGDLVWGFDAWKAIDSGLGFGSEGEGPRELPLGEVYETIPAVTETKVVLDAKGNPTTETEEVVITEAIEKKVSPAGVDQSKITALLLAKIEQLERRLTLAGL